MRQSWEEFLPPSGEALAGIVNSIARRNISRARVMTTDSRKEVSLLLLAWSHGDQEALDKLLPLVYQEMHRLAHRYMSRERAGNTLQTTALVHEAYVRLVDGQGVQWENRAHFFAVAAKTMRRILVDLARARSTRMRRIVFAATAKKCARFSHCTPRSEERRVGQEC